MRASDLLDEVIYDDTGRELGRVHDIKLVQDGPAVEGQDATFRVESLLVGRRGLAVRLGYTRNEVRGPWLLRYLARHGERRVTEIPWPTVTRRSDRWVQVRPPSN